MSCDYVDATGCYTSLWKKFCWELKFCSAPSKTGFSSEVLSSSIKTSGFFKYVRSQPIFGEKTVSPVGYRPEETSMRHHHLSMVCTYVALINSNTHVRSTHRTIINICKSKFGYGISHLRLIKAKMERIACSPFLMAETKWWKDGNISVWSESKYSSAIIEWEL